MHFTIVFTGDYVYIYTFIYTFIHISSEAMEWKNISDRMRLTFRQAARDAPPGNKKEKEEAAMHDQFDCKRIIPRIISGQVSAHSVRISHILYGGFQLLMGVPQ